MSDISDILKSISPEISEEIIQLAPVRFSEYLKHCLSGYSEKIEDIIEVFENKYGSDQVICAENIEFSSLCEHHLTPFYGTVDISYIPNQFIVGFGNIPQIVKHCSKKLQLQEKLTNDIVQIFETHVKPKQIDIKITAKHECCRVSGNGINEKLSNMVTRIVRQY